MESRYIIFILFLVMATTVQWEFIPTDEGNIAFFHIIKNAFNKRNPAIIYQLLSDAAQKSTSIEIFSGQLLDIQSRQGDIAYWTYSTKTPDQPSLLLGFDKYLGTGTLFWNYSGSNLNYFSLNDHSNPSLAFWMKDNNDQFSFSAIADDQKLINYNGDQQKGLMGVFRIIVAIEFSKQASEWVIKQDDWISLNEINKYYIPDVDKFHTNYLQIMKEQEKIQEDKVQLIEVARGMIAFGSDACTEYLQTLLTLYSIDQTINDLGLIETQTYYMSSFLLVFLNHDNLSRESYISQLKSLTIQEIIEKSQNIHNSLFKQSESAQQLLLRGKELQDGEIIEILSQYFTKSTTNQYTKLLNQLNKGSLFKKEFYDIFYPLLGYVSLNNPALSRAYEHVGIQQGLSAFQGDYQCIITVAYFQDLRIKNPYKMTSMALFIGNIRYQTEFPLLLARLNEFIALTSLNGHYLNAVAALLSQYGIEQL